MNETDWQEVAGLVDSAQTILFITGAGISADSGMPTYRGVGGLYEDHEIEGGHRIEDVLSGGFFSRHPEITWRYLWEIGDACRDVEPNAAHYQIAGLEKKGKNIHVLTQNVDGLHTQAGSSNVIEVHGNVGKLICVSCTYRCESKSITDKPLPPRCPECSGVIRPEVVLFGEFLSEQTQEAMLELSQCSIDLVFSIGTSSLFPYISEPVYMAKQFGIPTVEINPGATDLSQVVDFHLKAGAAEAMLKLA